MVQVPEISGGVLGMKRGLSLLRLGEHRGRGVLGREEAEKTTGCHKRRSPGQDMAVALKNSLWLWLPAQNVARQHLIAGWEGTNEALFLPVDG